MDEIFANLIGKQITLPGHFEMPVLLEHVRALGSGYECRVRLPKGTLEEVVISAEEATALAGTTVVAVASAPIVDAEKLRLLLESARVRLAYAHDKEFAVSLSGIRPLPHQIEAVYQKMLPQPRLRFLLADDPGVGKTIMAGLLLKEMKLREAIERILILCPAPLTIQWQDEMLRWFGESFDIIFSAIDQQQLTNPWHRSTQVIASLDYAKQDGVWERVCQEHWDLVIIDEAHKCSARTTSGGRGRESKIDPTKRYELALKLTADADHVLLLTATPHHGDEDKFAHFLRLLDPDLFPEPHRLGKETAAIRKEIFRLGDHCPWALRRLKEDLSDLQGKRLFPDRHAKSVTFCLTSEEYSLYKAVTAYINEFIPQQTGTGCFEIVPGDFLVNLPAHPHPPQEMISADPQKAADFLKSTYQLECRSRCQKERQHFAQICGTYLEKSFEARIKKAQERAMKLAGEAVVKPEFKLASDEAFKHVEELERARKERIAGLKRLEIARTGPVRHLATAAVLVSDTDLSSQIARLSEEMEKSIRKKIELAAEDKVVQLLIAEGFPRECIERVGHLKLGFDIRAHRVKDTATGALDASFLEGSIKDKNPCGALEVRRIEVKGRAKGQPILLTVNEWYKALHLAETYWLYVVWNPLEPNAGWVAIQNPAAKLDHAKKEIVAARFFEIPADALEEYNE